MKPGLIIVLIFIGIILIAITFLPAILMFIYVHNLAKKRKEIQNELEQVNRDILKNGLWFPVRYCSAGRFKKFLQFFPWEATGILFISNSQIIFFSSYLLWKNLQFEIPKEKTQINLIGKKILKNGFLSWISINSSTQTYYFTSETGITYLFKSAKTTKEMHEKILNYLKLNS
jgi:hypothetical protein